MTRTEHDMWRMQAGVAAKRLAGVVLAAACLALAIVLGVVVAFVALAGALIAGLAIAIAWGVKRTRQRHRPASSDPGVLEARRGPQGWTVDVNDTLHSGRFG